MFTNGWLDGLQKDKALVDCCGFVYDIKSSLRFMYFWHAPDNRLDTTCSEGTSAIYLSFWIINIGRFVTILFI